jgi:2-dehydropantoate 2-reductase
VNILVMGAGAIGGYLGGALRVAGLDVNFVGRPEVLERLHNHGLHLTDYQGLNLKVPPPVSGFSSLQQCPGPADLVLLTVKCTGVAQAAQELAPWISPATVVVCFQNGVGSKSVAAQFLPAAQLLSGMIPFNVLNAGEGRLHRGTEGEVRCQRHPALEPLVEAWNRVGVPAAISDDFESVAWGKLLLNLNNAINALAGVPLLEELSQRSYRLVLAACMSELLASLKAAQIQPARLARLPPSWLPWVLRLPDWLFQRVARKMLAIDPLARSSMWEDLERRRPTEIDFLNGAVLGLAARHRVPAPVNSKIIEWIRQAETSQQGSPNLSGQQLVETLL